MHIKLTDFMTLVGYGIKVVVVEVYSDEEIYRTDYFTPSYQIEQKYKDIFKTAEVQNFSIFYNTLYIFVAVE